MKTIGFVLTFATVFFAGISLRAQGIHSFMDAWYADQMKVKSPDDFKLFRVDATRNYVIKDEGEEIDWYGLKLVVAADLTVNGDTLTMIRYSEAVLRDDTLDILLYQFDAAHDHNFQIRIANNKCFMFYDFSYPADIENRRIETIDFKLTLDNDTFARDSRIRGYVEFTGKCVHYCDATLIRVRGSFVATIQ
jgi:hypothetical protein